MAAFRFGTAQAHKMKLLRAQIIKQLETMMYSLTELARFQQRSDQWLTAPIRNNCRAAALARAKEIRHK